MIKSFSDITCSNQLRAVQGVDPEVKAWWSKAGKVSTRKREVKQRDDISVDHQIGALLIEVEDSKEAMEKLGRAVVPYLEISDPILGGTVSRASKGYGEISRIVRQLGRMRKLSATNHKGARVEYNRQVHEMLGGHQPGTRIVKVLRNGIQKDFGGVIKTIIKEWVEPVE